MSLGLYPEHISPSSLFSHTGLLQHPVLIPLGNTPLRPAHCWSVHLTVNEGASVGPQAARVVANGCPVT